MLKIEVFVWFTVNRSGITEKKSPSIAGGKHPKSIMVDFSQNIPILTGIPLSLQSLQRSFQRIDQFINHYVKY